MVWRQKKSTKTVLLDQKIQHLFSLQNEINVHDRDIFTIPIEERYKMTDRQKEKWIENTEQTVYQCIEEHRTKMQTGQHNIRKYFGSKQSATMKESGSSTFE